MITNQYSLLEFQFKERFLETIPAAIRPDVIQRLNNPNHQGKGKTNNEIIQYVHNIFEDAKQQQMDFNLLKNNAICILNTLQSQNLYKLGATQAITVIENLFVSIVTPSLDHPPAEPLPQFSAADLTTFRAALIKTNKIKIDLNEGTFIVWYNSQFSAINIQDVLNYETRSQAGKIGIIIDSTGKMTSLRIGNTIQADNSLTIPNEFLPRVHACFKKALEVSSQYTIHPSLNHFTPAIQITAVRRGIKEIPEFHLNKLFQAIEESIKKQEDPKIKVSFLTDNLTLDQGIDAGGLSRDYLDDLMAGIKNSLSSKAFKGSLILPHAKQYPEALSPLSSLNQQEKALYQEIGKVMIYCYLSKIIPGHWDKTYLTGRYFDDSLFAAILSLTAEEIHTPFESLTLATKLKMCRALFEAHTNAGIDLNYLKPRFDWLDQFDHLDDNQIVKVAEHLMYAESLPDNLTMNQEGEEPDLAKIKANRAQFKTCLIHSLFLQKGEHGQFGAQLAPIHAIAQGMKSICHPGPMHQSNDNHHWNTIIRGIPYLTLSNKIQGSLDRKEIANHMVLVSNLQGNAKIEMSKKLTWLKEWICDAENGASEEELRDLLKFLTGSSGFQKDKTIQVKPQYGTYYPVPCAHTCSFEMDLSPIPSQYGIEHDDYTKQNFIKSLKELALANPSTYQTD